MGLIELVVTLTNLLASFDNCVTFVGEIDRYWNKAEVLDETIKY
jgi:hypothetical protein